MPFRFGPLFGCAVLFAGVVAALPASAGPGRDRLESFLKDFTTLEAKFDQSLIDEQGKVLEQSQGTVVLARPGKFRWDYLKPFEQQIVADGTKVWIYDKDLEQVTVKTLNAAVGSVPAMVLDSKGVIDEHFAIYELGEDQGLTWVALRPKEEEESAQYTDVRLGFDAKGLRMMELKDSFGQTTRIAFKDEMRDTKIDPALFEFKPPAGVDVINAAEPM